MAQEFESHVQMHIDDNVRAGMSPEQARREVLVKFGGMEAAKESVRETSRLMWLDSRTRCSLCAARASAESGLCHHCGTLIDSRHRRERSHLYGC